MKHETDLYAPLRAYLEQAGYTVRSEVHGCDIAATQEGELILIELKQRVSLDLLLQAVRRQRLSDSVYVAVPASKEMTKFKRWRRLQHLLRRLELGLIVVHLKDTPPRVDVLFHPIPFQRRKQPQQRRALLREMAGRSIELNLGGSSKRPIVTAYREAALYIACALQAFGPLSPAALRKQGATEKTQRILYDNVYGWFARVDRGVYELTPRGTAAITEYAALTRQLTARLSRTTPEAGPKIPVLGR